MKASACAQVRLGEWLRNWAGPAAKHRLKAGFSMACAALSSTDSGCGAFHKQGLERGIEARAKMRAAVRFGPLWRLARQRGVLRDEVQIRKRSGHRWLGDAVEFRVVETPSSTSTHARVQRGLWCEVGETKGEDKGGRERALRHGRCGIDCETGGVEWIGRGRVVRRKGEERGGEGSCYESGMGERTHSARAHRSVP
eukprot:4387935-Pleurochrysis_carterae.AAC.3